ncbi:hypothetical protein [Paenibacillus thiaminolyticus]|nr:hypothetical protein [Paenibacillus thiaminolyticus]
MNLKADTRFNGPAVLAYQMAGGKGPSRYGSNNAWSVHHIYSGKFEYIDQEKTIHATKEGKLFTQSAGLVVYILSLIKCVTNIRSSLGI